MLGILRFEDLSFGIYEEILIMASYLLNDLSDLVFITRISVDYMTTYVGLGVVFRLHVFTLLF